MFLAMVLHYHFRYFGVRSSSVEGLFLKSLKNYILKDGSSFVFSLERKLLFSWIWQTEPFLICGPQFAESSYGALCVCPSVCSPNETIIYRHFTVGLMNVIRDEFFNPVSTNMAKFNLILVNKFVYHRNVILRNIEGENSMSIVRNNSVHWR